MDVHVASEAFGNWASCTLLIRIIKVEPHPLHHHEFLGGFLDPDFWPMTHRAIFELRKMSKGWRGKTILRVRREFLLLHVHVVVVFKHKYKYNYKHKIQYKYIQIRDVSPRKGPSCFMFMFLLLFARCSCSSL